MIIVKQGRVCMTTGKYVLVILFFILSSYGYANAQISYSGIQPGKADAEKKGGQMILENKVLKLNLQVIGGKITAVSFEDKQGHQQIALHQSPLFELTLTGGRMISSTDFTLSHHPEAVNIEAETESPIEANRLGGKKYTADLEDTKLGLKVHWEASLHDGTNYIRQVFTFTANDAVKIAKITLIKLPAAAGIRKAGTVDGSPLVYGNLFFSVEHPMSQTLSGKAFITAYLPRLEALHSKLPLTISSVWGTTPAGQLRRGFLYYIEHERAHPYRQVLHYNSWFDLSWQDRKMNEKDCLDRIKVFKDSLIDKRKVKMDAFLFDDGWDDNKTLWQFNSGFPDGFTKMTAAAKACGAGIGVWISPWGGYDDPKIQRLAFGKQQIPAFETNDNGFSLTGPIYYNRFKEVTTSFIKNYNVSMFKFDGVGSGNGASGASITYQKDIEAFLKLITELRAEKSDLYLSLTVGTWPSVYWLKYGDAIWRAGEDTGLAGEGPKRQQWITYKDAQAYKNIVKRGPLFPLNAIMYHGICIAENGLPGQLEMDNKNIADEIWAFFGTGTGLQELYVNPHLLNANNWDNLQKASSWSKAHKNALADIHWLGGDPVKGEVYGYAGWADQIGVLTLRNPTGRTKTFVVNVKQALDIPAGLTDNYQFFDARSEKKVFTGHSFTVKLAPYEVKVMDAKTL